MYDLGTTTTALSSKIWTFGASGAGASQGLAVTYEEYGASGPALMHTDYTWTSDASGNLYVSEVKRTDQPGTSQVQSKSTQTLDPYGNVSESKVYDYGLTLAKTYNYSYVTDSNYTSKYIFNRVSQVTLTPVAAAPPRW